ncbi:MAG: HAMP domain-containing protein [Firmicutes bacterium]|nr:HAMP domain-containing protein [Bacillota bacterium]
MFNKMGLRVKLITLFLLIGLVPAIAISLIAYNNTAQQLKEDAFNQLEMFADLSVNHLEEFMENKEAALGALAVTRNVYQSMNVLRETSWDTTDPGWRERVGILEEMAPTAVEEFGCEFLFLTAPNGEVVFSTHKEMIGSNLLERDYIQGALTGRNAWGEIIYSDLVNKNVLTVSAPIKSGATSGEIVGILNLGLGQDYIAAAVHEGIEELGRTADAYLFDAEGLLLTDTVHGEYAQGAALKQKIGTRAYEVLSGPLKSSNYGFSTFEEYEDYLGKNVFGALAVTRIADKPTGFIMEIEAEEVLAAVGTMRNLMVTIAVACAAVIAVAAFFVAQTIVRPVQKVSDLTVKLAEGDFTVEADVASRDEIGQMAAHINRTVQSLSETLSMVQETAQNVSHASSEISTGNQDLSQRTQEQASSLEEIASTVEEIASSLETSSSNAGEADSIAKGTLDGVHRGEETVKNLRQAMEEITQGSQEISEIIGQVNDIAFQTNLLALNAAVEAARAGEQGRGFAVVASEVRNLAGRAAESAKEIEKRIKDSIARVENGNVLMDETESVLQEVITDTERAGDVVGEIASALQELSAGVGDIRDAIEELNQVTQQNASLVEEIASSSENMNSEAVEMANQVSFFKLAENGYQNQRGKLKKETAVSMREKNNNFREKPKEKENAVALTEQENDFQFNEEDFEKF